MVSPYVKYKYFYGDCSQPKGRLSKFLKAVSKIRLLAERAAFSGILEN